MTYIFPSGAFIQYQAEDVWYVFYTMKKEKEDAAKRFKNTCSTTYCT